MPQITITIRANSGDSTIHADSESAAVRSALEDIGFDVDAVCSGASVGSRQLNHLTFEQALQFAKSGKIISRGQNETAQHIAICDFGSKTTLVRNNDGGTYTHVNSEDILAEDWAVSGSVFYTAPLKGGKS